MFFLPVNFLAVLASAALSMVIGFLWYSPVLFGKPWMKLRKLDPKKMAANKQKMMTSYAWSFAASLVMIYVLAQLIDLTLAANWVEGATLGAMVWLGFVATTMVTGVLFERKPWALFLINSGYQLVCLTTAGTILAVWF